MPPAAIVAGLALLGGGLGALYETRRVKTPTEELAQEAVGQSQLYLVAGAGALAGAALGMAIVSWRTPPPPIASASA